MAIPVGGALCYAFGEIVLAFTGSWRRPFYLLVLPGIALGTLGSIAVARLIASLLFATSPWDALTFVSMVIVILALATVSGLIPARRASRLDPLAALRTE